MFDIWKAIALIWI